MKATCNPSSEDPCQPTKWLHLTAREARCVRAALLRAAGDKSFARAGGDAVLSRALAAHLTIQLRGWDAP